MPSIHAEPAHKKIAFRSGELPLLDAGQGSAVGYLHGLLGHSTESALTRILAAKGVHVVAPSLPGFGGSSSCTQLRGIYDWVFALSEIVDASCLTGKPMIASSVGAMLALELAAVRPEVFERLILISPLGLWDAEMPVADLFANTLKEERAMLTADAARSASFYDDIGVTDPEALVGRSVSRYVARSTAASLIWPIPEFGLAARLHRVACPVTLIWGGRDRLVPIGYLQQFVAALPNAVSTSIIEEAGHLADWDCPEAVADIVLEALRR